MNVVDLGCGSAQMLSIFKNVLPTQGYVGIDWSGAALKINSNSKAFKGIEVDLADEAAYIPILQKNISSNTLVICTQVLDHMLKKMR